MNHPAEHAPLPGLFPRGESPGNTLSPIGENPSGRPVAVLGASPNPERYSHMAVALLKSMGFPVIPIHSAVPEIYGVPAVKSLADIRLDIHTLTLYVGPKRLPSFLDDILRLRPQRVIFNPGTESPEAIEVLDRSGIECVEGCTLVMLKTGQF